MEWKYAGRWERVVQRELGRRLVWRQDHWHRGDQICIDSYKVWLTDSCEATCEPETMEDE